MSTASSGESSDAAPRRGLWTLLWICWLVGLVLSAVLAWHHHQLASGSEEGLAGCSGGGFDCDKVLTSPYGKLWGISVTWFALAYYLVMGVALAAVGRLARTSPGTPAALALPALAAIGLATAGWDVGVMVGVIGSLCPWCLGVHAANTLFFLLAAAWAQSAWQGAERSREAAGQPRLGVRPAITAGVLAVVLAGWQMAVLALFHDPVDLVVVARDIPLSKLRIGGDPAEDPPIWTVNGPRESANTVVVFSCFTCPQCKEAHRLLEEIAAEHPGEFRIDYRLNPLSPDCNPSLKGGVAVPPHVFACQLARVGMALAEVKPEEYPAFAHWLYDQQERIVPPFEAEDEAIRRAGREKIKQALDPTSEVGKRVSARMARDVKLSQEIQVQRVPQIYIGKTGAGEKGTQTTGQLSGHITREQLAEALAREFGWKSP
jgi:uncharacterized membrane protein/glutaredoxin